MESTATPPLQASTDVIWEVELETGWVAYDAANSALLSKAAADGANTVRMRVGSSNYEVRLPSPHGLGAADGEQQNLQFRTIRAVRRRPDVAPECDADPSHRFDPALSHTSLSISRDGLEVESNSLPVTDNKTRAAVGDRELADGSHRIVLIYTGGSYAYLCAGVAKVDEMQDAEGKPLCEWNRVDSNSCRRGVWLYSWFYNRFSANGRDWEKNPTCVDVNFEPGDELHIELLLQTGCLRFFLQTTKRAQVGFSGHCW